MKTIKYAFPVVLIALVLALLSGFFGTIQSGNVGVREIMGRINPEEITSSGIYFKWPFIETVKEFSAKEIGVDLNDLTPKAHDNLSLRDLDMTVYYKVSPGTIADSQMKYAALSARMANGEWYPSYELVTRVARNVIYEETSKMDSLTMHTKRDELAASIAQGLQTELERNDKGVFTITRVIVRNLTTDPAIERSIQESVAAQKQLETTQQRIKIAEAEAQVEVKKAEGIAKANQIINQSLTREYLQHESNLVLQKFAEKGGTSTVIIPANMSSAPLININK